MTCDCEVDVVGKSCPMPLIALAKAVRSLSRGQLLRITGNDPIFEESVAEFCHERGFDVLDTSREGRTVSMVLRV